MQNILEGFHNPEKEKFLNGLHDLDHGFITTVSTKIKTFHFSQQPEYEREFEKKYALMTETNFIRIFELA